jgi:hypothetical protein
VIAVFGIAGYFISRAFGGVKPTPDPAGFVCTDSGVIPTAHGAISAAECHRG